MNRRWYPEDPALLDGCEVEVVHVGALELTCTVRRPDGSELDRVPVAELVPIPGRAYPSPFAVPLAARPADAS